MTNNNGFWIGWLDLLALLLHLLLITIDYDSSQSVTAQDSLHSLLDYECLLFHCDDLALIYESATSSPSVVRWLALHSWTLNSLTNESSFTNELLHHSGANVSLKSKSKLRYDRRSVGQSFLMSSTHLGLMTRFSLLSDSCGFVDMGVLSDERTELSFTNAAGPRQRSHSRVRVPLDSWPYFTASDSRPPTWRSRFPYLYPQEQGGPVIHPGTGFPFRCLLQLAGPRWRYSAPPPHGPTPNQSLNYVSYFYNSGRTEERPPPRTIHLLLPLFVFTGTCLPNRCLAMDYSASIRCCVNVC
jgi:hypothetical protein